MRVGIGMGPLLDLRIRRIVGLLRCRWNERFIYWRVKNYDRTEPSRGRVAQRFCRATPASLGRADPVGRNTGDTTLEGDSYTVGGRCRSV